MKSNWRWQQESLKEVLRQENEAILQLTEILASQTIEQLLKQSDEEVGLEYLLRPE
ncbi:MAG: hypothetical protein JST84_04575 [Acidobacteria bacterium]|nr:hypothetical protein [Acidobacteriota bacterium]